MKSKFQRSLERGRAALAAANAQRQTDTAKRRREVAAAWDQRIGVLMERGLPEWAVEYLYRSETAMPTMYDLTRLDVPGCAPIMIHLWGASTSYLVAEPLAVDHDEEWFVVTRHNTSANDFDSALALAESYGESYAEMELEVARRNAACQMPHSAPPLASRLETVDAAAQLASILDSLTHTGSEAGSLWAALAIHNDLVGIRTALEDIAAALTDPIIRE